METNPYCFPPFALIAPLLSLLKEQKVRRCTLILPQDPSKTWFSILRQHTSDSRILGAVSEKGVVWYPGPRGYHPDTKGLEIPLYAFRLGFSD